MKMTKIASLDGVDQYGIEILKNYPLSGFEGTVLGSNYYLSGRIDITGLVREAVSSPNSIVGLTLIPKAVPINIDSGMVSANMVRPCVARNADPPTPNVQLMAAAMARAVKGGSLDPEKIDERMFHRYLDEPDMGFSFHAELSE